MKVQASPCCICNRCVAGMVQSRFHTIVNENGDTCLSKQLEIARIEQGTIQCTVAVSNTLQRTCCDPTFNPPTITPTPTTRPTPRPRGPNNPCNLCRHNGFVVTNPAMVINLLNVGVARCDEMYEYARLGYVKNHMCDPLKYYAFEPCGCKKPSSSP